MYYAVKKVINYDPAALSEQSTEEHAALNGDTQYAETVKAARRADVIYAICICPILPAFTVAAIFFASSAPNARWYALIPLTIFIISILLSRVFRNKRDKAEGKRDAIYCSHISLAVDYYDTIQNNRILACYGKPNTEDKDLFDLTVVTIPKGQSEYEFEENPAKRTVCCPFSGVSLSRAGHDNLVLDLDHELLCFME